MASVVIQVPRGDAQKRKKRLIQELIDLLKTYNVIALADLTGLSSKGLQDIRKELRGKVVIKVAKNTIKRLALEQVKDVHPNIDKLEPYITGSKAILLTNDNPFKVQKLLDAKKVAVPAKPGQVAPNDIVVPAGNTGLNPGPILGELQRAGIPTKIEKGKITIPKDTVIVKAGEVVKEEHANALKRLEIFPFQVGLTIDVVYAEGDIIEGKYLKIDEEKTLQDLQTAASYALNLAVYIGYVTKETLPTLLAKAHQEAINLSVFIEYPTKETLPLLIAKAQREALALKKLAEKE